MTSSRLPPLEYFLEGNKDSKNLVVFLQGWPDNNLVWQPLQWKTTLNDNRLLFVNFPNTSTTQQTLPWGQDFNVIVERLKITFDQIGVPNFEKKIIVAHDWGCTYTYIFDKTYPKYFNELITLDVPGIVEINGLLPKLIVLLYQTILIIAFLIGGRTGKFLTQGVAKFFKHDCSYFEQINSARNYPYLYFYKSIFKGLWNKSNLLLYRYRPSVPVAYLYGKKKPMSFHGAKWQNYLLETDKCQIQGFDSGHWIMKKYGQAIVDTIIRRLKNI